MEQSKLRLALLDDHPLALVGLKGMLKDWPHGTVVLDALNVRTYEEMAPAKAPIHITLVDLVLPEQDGLDLIARIVKDQPDTRVIALTCDPCDELVRRALHAGARSVLPKNITQAELLKAMDSVRHTGYFVNDLMRKQLDEKGRLLPLPQAVPERIAKLFTPRERRFIRLACGPDNPTFPKVGSKMDLTPNGAEGYRKRVYKKLEVKHGRQDFYRIATSYNLHLKVD